MTTDTAAHPARRADTEAWLDSIGAAWTFDPEFDLGRIDAAASLANQVRHEPLDEEVVARYGEAMGRGEQFPPLLVAPHTKTTEAILGGNHRFASARARGWVKHPAYVVNGDELTLLRVRVEDNARHGVASTKAERIDHAQMLMSLGMSQADASKVVGIDQPQLSIAMTVRRAEERARGLDVPDQFFRLPETTRYTIAQVSDDAVFEALATFAAEAAPKAADLKALTRALKVTDTEEGLRLIGAEAEEHATRSRDLAGGVRSSSRSARAVFDTSLTQIAALKPGDIAASCPNADVAKSLAEKLMKAATVIAEAHALLTDMASPEAKAA
jgi:hypothetical protein